MTKASGWFRKSKCNKVFYEDSQSGLCLYRDSSRTINLHTSKAPRKIEYFDMYKL